MFLRTTLSAAPRVIKLHLLETLLKRDVFCDLGRSTPLQECVFICTCVFLVFVMEKMVTDGKNIKDLKFSKYKLSWFLYKVSFFKR